MNNKADDTVTERLHKLATNDPNSTAFGFINNHRELVSLTKKEISEFSETFGWKLINWGFDRGDVICNTLANSRARLITDLGIMAAGTVCLNGSGFLTEEEMMLTFRRSACVMVIIPLHGPMNALFRPYLPKNYRNFREPIWVFCDKAPSLKYVLVVEAHSHVVIGDFLSDLYEQSSPRLKNATEADETAYVFPTAGSTSVPKLVAKTHREILSIGEDLYGSLVDQDVFFNDRPLGWIGGFPFCCLVNGAMHLLQEVTGQKPLYPGRELLSCVADMGISVAMLTPLEIDIYVEAIYQANIQAKPLKCVIVGGQPIHKATYECLGVMTHRLDILYMSTEAGLICRGSITEKNKEYFGGDAWVGESCDGKDLQMRLEYDTPLTSSTMAKRMGRILLKGPQICPYYLDLTETQPSNFDRDGWYETGDIGYIDVNSDLHVMGRSCDAIKFGSSLIHPGLLEGRFRQCPGVADVAVVGIPHPVHYKEICVCIIPSRGSVINQEMVSVLYHQKCFRDDKDVTTPIPNQYYFMREFPLTESGKLARSQLVDLVKAAAVTKPKR